MEDKSIIFFFLNFHLIINFKKNYDTSKKCLLQGYREYRSFLQFFITRITC